MEQRCVVFFFFGKRLAFYFRERKTFAGFGPTVCPYGCLSTYHYLDFEPRTHPHVYCVLTTYPTSRLTVCPCYFITSKGVSGTALRCFARRSSAAGSRLRNRRVNNLVTLTRRGKRRWSSGSGRKGGWNVMSGDGRKLGTGIWRWARRRAGRRGRLQIKIKLKRNLERKRKKTHRGIKKRESRRRPKRAAP